MSAFDRFYERLPVWAQHAAVTTYGLYWHWLRFGPGFGAAAEGYARREWFSADEWGRWQEGRLRTLLSTSASHVPHYAEAWSAAEKRAARAGILEALPLLEKAAIRANPGAFVRRDRHPQGRLVFHTSGSTGTPIATLWTVAELRDSLALREMRSARWAGVSFKLPRATFSGRMVEPNPESPGPFYRYNAAERQVYLSPFHLRPDTAMHYADAMRRHGTRWLTGYAISYYLLARFIAEQGIQVPSLRGVITTSEKVTPEMRSLMERVYGCRVYEEYSTVENALFASECQHGRLHTSPDVAVVEILRPDGTPAPPGIAGEVVATSLLREFQPFIRYRLGDLAMWDTEPCPCGRAMPVIKEVVGRIEDIVVGPDGRQMVRFHGIFVDQPHIQEGQIVQEELHRIRVKVVPTGGFGPTDADDIIHRVQLRLGHQVEVIVEPVVQIPRTAAGKFQAVVSLVREEGVVDTERTGLMQ